ncbi:hypothetical protein [Microtetraspora malaysiensis]|uniref:Uncharacterized protein n=1 Tax=Microtetraspora malaysiensis TaxID=161358 RepID=A0ABW6SRP1_9ACTN
MAADAETTPLPKIVVPPPSSPSRSGKGLGDLPMRMVYRLIAGTVAVVAVGVGGAIVLSRGGDAAPSAAPIPSAAATAIPSLPVANGATGGPAATSGITPIASPLAGSPAASPQASSATTPATVTAVMQAALSDPRLRQLPERDRGLRRLYGRPTAARGLLKDDRSGVALPRFAKVWKLTPASPFTTRQMLPKINGTSFRGLLVTCPVPIPVQESVRDTAFLAARWTLNHHPSDATISWTASQPLKVGERDGWLLGYTVNYKIRGKKRQSMAALAVVDVARDKPALVFVTIPDTQRAHWRDINTVMSRIRVL